MSGPPKSSPYSMIELKEDEETVFGSSPDNVKLEDKDIVGRVVCPECGTEGPGIVSSEIPVASYIAVVVLLILIGKYAFFIAPFIFLLVNTQVRTCSTCGHVIETKLQFSMKSINEKFYTFKFSDDFIIVVSSRNLMIVGSFVLGMIVSIFTYEEFFAPTPVDPCRRLF